MKNKTIQPSIGSESLTVAVAQQLSRRSFLKSVGTLTLAIGLALKLPGQAQAATISCGLPPPSGCVSCSGNCSGVYSATPVCCHPNGGTCYQAICECPIYCGCWQMSENCFYTKEVVCSDGRHKACCLYTCFCDC